MKSLWRISLKNVCQDIQTMSLLIKKKDYNLPEPIMNKIFQHFANHMYPLDNDESLDIFTGKFSPLSQITLTKKFMKNHNFLKKINKENLREITAPLIENADDAKSVEILLNGCEKLTKVYILFFNESCIKKIEKNYLNRIENLMILLKNSSDTLTQLFLHFNRFSIHYSNFLKELLESCKNLHILNIDDVPIQKNSQNFNNNFLWNSEKNLEKLKINFRNFQFSINFFQNFINLKELEIYFHSTKKLFIYEFIDNLKYINKSLKILKFHGNLCIYPNFEYFTKILQSCPAIQCLHVNTVHRLKATERNDVCFRNINLPTNGIKELRLFLLDNTSHFENIHYLTKVFPQLETFGIFIGECFKENTTHEFPMIQGYTRNLRKFFFGTSGIGKTHAEILGNFLSQCSKLEEFSIDSINQQPGFLNSICQGLKSSKNSLQKLKFYLENRELSDYDTISSFLENCNCLSSFHLGSSGKCTNLSKLIDTLCHLSTKLTSISFQWCIFDKESEKSLENLLEKCKNLNTFELKSRSRSETFCRNILRCLLQSSSSLKVLKLPLFHLKSNELNDLQRIIQICHKLEIINIIFDLEKSDVLKIFNEYPKIMDTLRIINRKKTGNFPLTFESINTICSG